MKPGRKGWWIAGAALSIAAVAIVAWVRTRNAIPVDTFPAVRAPIEEIVTAVAAGTVKAVRESTLSSETGGRFVEVRVDEGSVVKRGDLLARAIDPELDRESDAARSDALQAEAALRQAEARRDEAERRYAAELARAENALRQAVDDQRRAAELQREGFLSLADKEARDTRQVDAREAVSLAGSGASAVRGIEREIEAQKARIAAARSRAASLSERARKLSLVAPFDGIVTKKTVGVGEAKLPGSPLFILSDPSDIYIEAQIDETESARVRVGQRCRMMPDAYQGETFVGRVSEIKPIVEASKDVSRANVIRVRAVAPPKPFRLGMSVDIEVVVGRKEDVLQLPSPAVMEHEGKKYVYVVSSGRIARRDVTVGVSNWDRSEILSGISAGETVVTSLERKDLAPGVRVVARPR